jgi:hypothetical protein
MTAPPCQPRYARAAWRRVRIAAVSWSAGRNASRRSSETVTSSAVTNVEIVATSLTSPSVDRHSRVT